MSYKFPEGAKFYFSQTFAAAKTLLTMSNADPTVCGSVAHGYVDNDEILLTSGWEDATQTIWRVDQLTADTFSVLGLETSDTNFYTPGGGANSSAQKVSGWVEIPQVLTITTGGGGPRSTTVNPLARRNGLKFVTGFEATDITLELGHDASDANYKTMLSVSRRLVKVAYKMVLAGGEATYGYGTMSVSEVPKMTAGQVNTVTAAFSLQGRAISYA